MLEIKDFSIWNIIICKIF
uniref:Uncharacterized protein n=1 Tax=Romanomermis culicivorax TaxID=13658 RepID=A0A915IS74_ROMCU